MKIGAIARKGKIREEGGGRVRKESHVVKPLDFENRILLICVDQRTFEEFEGCLQKGLTFLIEQGLQTKVFHKRT